MKQISDYPDVLSVHEICEILQIGKGKAYRLLKDGTIPHRRLGGNYRISKRELMKLFDKK